MSIKAFRLVAVIEGTREFFQALQLNKITADRLLAFRRWRSEQNVGPTMLNMEVGVIRRILKRAKLWSVIADDVKPLREPKSIGRALKPEEKGRLLATVAGKPEWEVAYCAALLALNTTMRRCEVTGLKRSSVDFVDQTLTVY